MRRSHRPTRTLVAVLFIFAAEPAHADIRWTQDKDGKQTVFVADDARWKFGEPVYLRVNVNANAAGRSEWLRWKTAASNEPTAGVNRQTGMRFNYQSVIDYFDQDPAKRGAKRRGETMSIATSKGIVKAIAFDLPYKGYDRDCVYFSVEELNRREILKGHLCDEQNGETPLEAVRDFVEALEFRTD